MKAFNAAGMTSRNVVAMMHRKTARKASLAAPREQKATFTYGITGEKEHNVWLGQSGMPHGFERKGSQKQRMRGANSVG